MLRIDEKTILVWTFDDAPNYLRELSPHGGNENWVVYVPFAIYNEFGEWGRPSWIDAIGHDAPECISEHKYGNGIVFIGVHS